MISPLFYTPVICCPLIFWSNFVTYFESFSSEVFWFNVVMFTPFCGFRVDNPPVCWTRD